tara:strand:- start:51 stop:308 length:258 start_codon:yes stop_codon:yes gene_type:complete
LANKHYRVGMKANGSTIVAIRYPENTVKKYEHWDCPARNCVAHMDVELKDGRVISSKDLILENKFKIKDIDKLEKFISDISGGVA